ncbi:Hypothetical predicted protein [Octopus vulgaris]|uniref:Transmembrane protein n=1 Tax=Octopus vulgaris TaxID=6645 RepID=A0AA36BTJ0_OCTVU|nr:Hypothetical predicted protein [Octopus vulgaris]
MAGVGQNNNDCDNKKSKKKQKKSTKNKNYKVTVVQPTKDHFEFIHLKFRIAVVVVVVVVVVAVVDGGGGCGGGGMVSGDDGISGGVFTRNKSLNLIPFWSVRFRDGQKNGGRSQETGDKKTESLRDSESKASI